MSDWRDRIPRGLEWIHEPRDFDWIRYPPDIRATSPVLEVHNSHLRDDTGGLNVDSGFQGTEATEAAPTANDQNIDFDTVYRLRLTVGDTNGKNGQFITDGESLVYRRNGGSWTALGDGNCDLANSANITNTGTCSTQLNGTPTGSSGSWDNGGPAWETGNSPPANVYAKNDWWECEFAFQVPSTGAFSATDTVEFSFSGGNMTATESNNVISTYTLNAAADPKSVTVPVGSATITGQVPTPSATANVAQTVPAGSVTITGQVPTVQTVDPQDVTVPVGSVEVTGYAPVATSDYAAEVMADEPVAYWRLGESSGDAVDVLGGYDGTWSGTPGYSTTGLIDSSDTAVTFSGDDHFSAGDIPFGGTALTVEFWVNLSASQRQDPIAKYYATGGNREWLAYFTASDEVRFAVMANPAVYDAATDLLGSALSAGTHHIACTFSGGSFMRIYVDGQLDVEDTTDVPASFQNTTEPVRVGQGGDGNPVSGVLDEVAVYGTALSGPRVLAHYEAGTRSRTQEVPAGSVTLTGQQPTIDIGASASVEIPAGAVTLAGAAPTIDVSRDAKPGAGSITVTGQVPTPNISRDAKPGAGSIAVTGYAPVPAVTAHVFQEVPAGSVAVTGQVPTLDISRSAEPGAGSVTVTGYAPSPEGIAGQTAQPGAGSLAVTGQVPTPDISRSAKPGAGSVTVTGYAPTPTAVANKVAQPPAGSVTFTGQVPTVTATAHVTVTPTVGSASVVGYAPTIVTTDHQTVTVPVGSLVFTGSVPAAQSSSGLTVPAGTLTLTGLAPTVAIADYLPPDAVPITAYIDQAVALTAYIEQAVNVNAYIDQAVGLTAQIDQAVERTAYIDQAVNFNVER